jgi:hypothetical protein
LLCWYKSTCCTGTNVHILTAEEEEEYLAGLRKLMGSVNPSAWRKAKGSGSIDLDEFVQLVIGTLRGCY